jgi:hypothetical protein
MMLRKERRFGKTILHPPILLERIRSLTERAQRRQGHRRRRRRQQQKRRRRHSSHSMTCILCDTSPQRSTATAILVGLKWYNPKVVVFVEDGGKLS